MSRGQRLSLYDCENGTLIKHLKGHKDKIYSVSFSHDGTKMASGGADKSTIIWNEDGKGILRFSHSESVQVVAYNPVEHLLASCSSSDFGFWSPHEKGVVKHKVDSKIICASWRSDGYVLAIGFYSGEVSFYNTMGSVIGTIYRNAPVWSLCWNKNNESDQNCGVDLVVGSWDMTLSFYDKLCEQRNEDIYLNYYPACITFFGKLNEYIIVSGSSGNLNLYNRCGLLLHSFSEPSDNWVWYVNALKGKNVFACVDSSGVVTCKRMIADVIYSRWKQKVCFREALSNIVIQDVGRKEMRKIEYDKVVKAITIFDHKVAIATEKELTSFEIDFSNENIVMNKFSIDIDTGVDCIQVSTKYVVVSTKKMIKAYNSKGQLSNCWYCKSCITSIQVVCSNSGEETLLIGCLDGKVLLLSIGSPFCTNIMNLKGQISAIEVSSKGRYIGFIYDRCNLLIYDQIKKHPIQDMKGPESVHFHNEIENMYCCNSSGIVTIQDTNGASILESSIVGSVINFSGMSITFFCKKDMSIHDTKVNILSLAEQKLKNCKYEDSYNLAKLGASNDFLRTLAREALINENFSVSLKCYQNLNLTFMIKFVKDQKAKLPQDCNSSKEVKSLLAAEVAILENNFDDAFRILRKAGMIKHLIDRCVRLKRFEDAKDLLSLEQSRRDHVYERQAEWEIKLKKWGKASSLYMEIGQYMKAVNVVGDSNGGGWTSLMSTMCDTIPSVEVDALKKCCFYLSKEEGMDDVIKNVYTKIQDYSSLMQLYIRNCQWMEASNICKLYEEDIDKALIILYADWLASQGNWSEAIPLYRKCDRQDKSVELIKRLLHNATFGQRYKEASSLCWTISRETFRTVRISIVIYVNCCFDAFIFIMMLTIEFARRQKMELVTLCLHKTISYHTYITHMQC